MITKRGRIIVGPPQQRHQLQPNVDRDGKPDGTYRCMTCIRLEKRAAQ